VRHPTNKGEAAMLYRLLLLSALVTLAGIGIPSRAVFFVTANTKAQNLDAMSASVADLDALEKQKLLNHEAMTDRDGRFRIAGLAPGLKYDVRTAGLSRENLSVEPGKDRDLGDLK
jgi:hypothetical protein